ncbi:DEBR0S1_14730g1_1 [Brettanomyces bruxellensis]|uniref:DEBR0S1_14730g1_1 n=1 Tax=Dekkera bruxellensis TaxID=5007 RepID=A0A7D9CVG2_DEKBR|nr:DEBR0S1_14730g1_1 [Brettanomyces bruxellensis]
MSSSGLDAFIYILGITTLLALIIFAIFTIPIWLPTILPALMMFTLVFTFVVLLLTFIYIFLLLMIQDS